jgi:hypothetical protein
VSSLCKKVVETRLLTEMIAPPTMTDETELAIAGMTSLHGSPLGFEGGRDSTTHRNDLRDAVESNKFRGSVIAMQRSGSQSA